MDLVKNTFAPNLTNEYFRTTDLITGLKLSAIDYKTLSPKAKEMVTAWEQAHPNRGKKLTRDDFRVNN